MYQQAANLGMELLPVRSPAEIVKLIEAELLFPRGTPLCIVCVVCLAMCS